jgi:ADP-heptose:LPS heptosyltransferase
VFPIKRKLRSAIWRLNRSIIDGYHVTIQSIVEAVTEKYWLLDYLPTFFKKKEGVLLVRLDLIGDFVLWLDSAQAYRQLYPTTKITLAVNSSCAELAEALPHWDKVISVNVQKLRIDYLYRLRMLASLRWRNFSTAIQPTFSREFVGDLVVRASIAKTRVGYSGDTNNISSKIKEKTDYWYSELVPNDPQYKMELNINAHFVRILGNTDFRSNLPTIPPAIGVRAQLNFIDPYVVVAPGASWGPKMWPVAHFAAVINGLVAEFDIDVVLCGGPEDIAVCSDLEQLVYPVKVTNLSGRTTLTELVEIIRRATLVLSNDSAPVHIAAATNTSAVCVVGGGHFGRFLPYVCEQAPKGQIPSSINYEMGCYGCRWECMYLDHINRAAPCVVNTPLEAVFAACLHKLAFNINQSTKGVSTIRTVLVR